MPFGFVVKNGSKIRAATSGGMPARAVVRDLETNAIRRRRRERTASMLAFERFERMARICTRRELPVASSALLPSRIDEHLHDLAVVDVEVREVGSTSRRSSLAERRRAGTNLCRSLREERPRTMLGALRRGGPAELERRANEPLDAIENAQHALHVRIGEALFDELFVQRLGERPQARHGLRTSWAKPATMVPIAARRSNTRCSSSRCFSSVGSRKMKK